MLQSMIVNTPHTPARGTLPPTRRHARAHASTSVRTPDPHYLETLCVITRHVLLTSENEEKHGVWGMMKAHDHICEDGV